MKPSPQEMLAAAARRLPAQEVLIPHLKLDDHTVNQAWSQAASLIQTLPLSHLRGQPLEQRRVSHPLHAAMTGLATLLQLPTEAELPALNQAAWALINSAPLRLGSDLSDAAWSALGVWAATLPEPETAPGLLNTAEHTSANWQTWRSAVSHTPAVAEVLSQLWTLTEVLRADPEWHAPLERAQQTISRALTSLGRTCPPETLGGLLRPLLCCARALHLNVPEWLRRSGLLVAGDEETATWLKNISEGENLSWIHARELVPVHLSAAALELNARCLKPLPLTDLHAQRGRARIQNDLPWLSHRRLVAGEAPPAETNPWEALNILTQALELRRAHPGTAFTRALSRELERINQHDAALLYQLLSGQPVSPRGQFQATRLILWWNTELRAGRLTLPRPDDAPLLSRIVRVIWIRLGETNLNSLSPEDQLRQIWCEQELRSFLPGWPESDSLTPGSHPQHAALLKLLALL